MYRSTTTISSASPGKSARRSKSRRRSVEEALDQVAPRLRALDEEERKRLRTLEREIAEATVQPLADELAEKYAVSADALDFTRSLARDVIAQSEALRNGDDPASADSGGTLQRSFR